MSTGLLLLRRRDVMALGNLSEWKYRTLCATGALRPLAQKGAGRKHLFPAFEVEKVVDHGHSVSHG